MEFSKASQNKLKNPYTFLITVPIKQNFWANMTSKTIEIQISNWTKLTKLKHGQQSFADTNWAEKKFNLEIFKQLEVPLNLSCSN